MLNYAIRYRPIVHALQATRPVWVLEVGSGPEGLAMFWRGRVVGTDLTFKRRPMQRGVAASALALPFDPNRVPAVVSCDMLEHIPPSERRAAVWEMARVAADTLLLGFPSGAAAAEVYEALASTLRPRPRWLQEHLNNGLPDAGQVAGWLRSAGWRVEVTWYESAVAHAALLRWEARLPVRLFTFALMRVAGPWLVSRISTPARPPFLRVLLHAVR